jgi:hypothetical protein
MEALKKYIIKHRMIKYEQGQKDCVLFISRWHDQQYKTNTSKDIEGKYCDAKSAKEYLKKVDNPLAWLKRMGYKRSKDMKNGDVLITNQKDFNMEGFITPFLFLNGLAYTVGRKGLIGIRPNKIAKVKIWRAP